MVRTVKLRKMGGSIGATLPRDLAERLHLDVGDGGSPGIRDEGLLESAIARPEQKWHYHGQADLSSLAAAYAFGIAKNQPFVDGNKRLAFVAAYAFLAINDFELEAPEPEAATVILWTAGGSLSEADLASWIRSHLIPWVDRSPGFSALHSGSSPSSPGPHPLRHPVGG